jgi:hypothetical protein
MMQLTMIDYEQKRCGEVAELCQLV